MRVPRTRPVWRASDPLDQGIGQWGHATTRMNSASYGPYQLFIVEHQMNGATYAIDGSVTLGDDVVFQTDRIRISGEWEKRMRMMADRLMRRARADARLRQETEG